MRRRQVGCEQRRAFAFDSRHRGARLTRIYSSRRCAAPGASSGDRGPSLFPNDRFHTSPDGRTILYARRDSSVDDLMLVRSVTRRRILTLVPLRSGLVAKTFGGFRRPSPCVRIATQRERQWLPVNRRASIQITVKLNGHFGECVYATDQTRRGWSDCGVDGCSAAQRTGDPRRPFCVGGRVRRTVGVPAPRHSERSGTTGRRPRPCGVCWTTERAAAKLGRSAPGLDGGPRRRRRGRRVGRNPLPGPMRG